MGIGRKENPVNKEPEENQRLPGEQLQLASQRTEPGGRGRGACVRTSRCPGRDVPQCPREPPAAAATPGSHPESDFPFSNGI